MTPMVQLEYNVYPLCVKVLNHWRRKNISCRNYVWYCMLFIFLKKVKGYFVQTKKKDCRLTKVGKICYMRKNENNTWMYKWLSF